MRVTAVDVHEPQRAWALEVVMDERHGRSVRADRRLHVTVGSRASHEVPHDLSVGCCRAVAWRQILLRRRQHVEPEGVLVRDVHDESAIADGRSSCRCRACVEGATEGDERTSGSEEHDDDQADGPRPPEAGSPALASAEAFDEVVGAAGPRR